MNLCDYAHSEPTMKVNFMLIPVTKFTYNETDIEQFNAIYKYCLSTGFNHFVRTPSNGISIKRENIRGPRWDIHNTTSLVEITLKDYDGCYYRFQIGYGKDKEHNLSGRKCWIAFCKICKDNGIDIKKFALGSKEEGLKAKSEIPMPIIKVMNKNDYGKTFNNCHHLDLNSSYMSGIAAKYKELKPVVKQIYNMRKDKNEIYKAILTHTFGWLQSRWVEYKYSHLARAAVVYNNNYINYLVKDLQKTGRYVIAINTDGIWYQGEVYHNPEFESYQLGGYKNDHINCKLRYKSEGAYEYIENGKYYPVVRGTTSYEKYVPRDQWQWGDIYKGNVLKYKFVTGEGVIRYDN